jgi:DNA-binding PadR family transcriptional regulator
MRGAIRHSYEIGKALEERSEGQYFPSLGVVYPNLRLFP